VSLSAALLGEIERNDSTVNIRCSSFAVLKLSTLLDLMLEAGVPPALMICLCVGELSHCAVTKDSMARYGEPLFERVFFAARYFESWLNTSVLELS